MLGEEAGRRRRRSIRARSLVPDRERRRQRAEFGDQRLGPGGGLGRPGGPEQRVEQRRHRSRVGEARRARGPAAAGSAARTARDRTAGAHRPTELLAGATCRRAPGRAAPAACAGRSRPDRICVTVAPCPCPARPSNQAKDPKARPAGSGDDDMVVDADFERAAGLGDAAGGVDVALARLRIAGRVVVGEDQGGGADLERAAHDLARIDRRLVDRALAHHLVAQQPVLRIEEEDAQPLGRQVRHVGEEIVDQRLRNWPGSARSSASARSTCSITPRTMPRWPITGLSAPRTRAWAAGPAASTAGQRPEFVD